LNDAADDVFDALADPTRRGLLRAVVEHGPVTATELAGDLPITRQAVAKHLVVLRDAGLVAASRAGRETRYDATPAPLGAAADWLAATGSAWDRRLEGLDRHLRRGPNGPPERAKR
jgi:DNA-binding transcriptional ArsR family regulator